MLSVSFSGSPQQVAELAEFLRTRNYGQIEVKEEGGEEGAIPESGHRRQLQLLQFADNVSKGCEPSAIEEGSKGCEPTASSSLCAYASGSSCWFHAAEATTTQAQNRVQWGSRARRSASGASGTSHYSTASGRSQCDATEIRVPLHQCGTQRQDSSELATQEPGAGFAEEGERAVTPECSNLGIEADASRSGAVIGADPKSCELEVGDIEARAVSIETETSAKGCEPKAQEPHSRAKGCEPRHCLASSVSEFQVRGECEGGLAFITSATLSNTPNILKGCEPSHAACYRQGLGERSGADIQPVVGQSSRSPAAVGWERDALKLVECSHFRSEADPGEKPSESLEVQAGPVMPEVAVGVMPFYPLGVESGVERGRHETRSVIESRLDVLDNDGPFDTPASQRAGPTQVLIKDEELLDLSTIAGEDSDWWEEDISVAIDLCGQPRPSATTCKQDADKLEWGVPLAPDGDYMWTNQCVRELLGIPKPASWGKGKLLAKQAVTFSSATCDVLFKHSNEHAMVVKSKLDILKLALDKGGQAERLAALVESVFTAIMSVMAQLVALPGFVLDQPTEVLSDGDYTVDVRNLPTLGQQPPADPQEAETVWGCEPRIVVWADVIVEDTELDPANYPPLTAAGKRKNDRLAKPG